MYRLLILAGVAFAPAAHAATLCPDGTYVGGSSCQLAPDGSYVSGDSRPRLAPSGNYTSGQPQLADSVEKVASLKWLQICQITNDIFD
jgi:hypothetical protein